MEDKVERNTQVEQQNETRLKKCKGSLRELKDNMKCNNIRIIGILEREEKKQGIENLFEKIMTESFPNLERRKDMQVQEAQMVPIKMKPKRSTPSHIIIKIPNFKDKERILKAEIHKQIVTYKGTPIRLAADFSKEHSKPEGNGKKYSKL